ncbi:MAG: SCO family protein [Deltaproteobacteria bacterium]|nr:SCO family protein [Deltaproteobacteria bacterium]MBW2420062.1 SCO family protein [Deltaproteobacteria bacterium]
MTRSSLCLMRLFLVVAMAFAGGCGEKGGDPLAADPSVDSSADPHASMDHGQMDHGSTAGDAPLADRSIYQLEGAWTHPAGGEFQLSQLRGHPVLVVLFYGTCEHACPILVRNVQQIEAQLDPAGQDDTRFLLVTFDPDVDTPERLVKYAEKNGLDPASWFLPHGEPHQIRALALVLGIRYRPSGDGQFSHTTRISLLDREGVVAAHVDGLDAPSEPIVTRLKALLGEP